MSGEDCGVCLAEFDGDPAELWNVRHPVARKPHECYECREAIPPGARYDRIVMKFEGDFSTYAICAACSDIQTSLSCDGSRTIGYLWEEIRDYLFPEATIQGCINRLQTAAGKAKLLAEWQKWKGLHA